METYLALLSASIVLCAGCLVGLPNDDRVKEGQVAAWTIQNETKVPVSSIGKSELDKAPSLRRVLNRAVESPNGSYGESVTRDTVENIVSVLEDKKGYFPREPPEHHDTVYLRYNETLVLVRPYNRSRMIVVRSARPPRERTITNVTSETMQNVSRLREALTVGSQAEIPVEFQLNQSEFDAAVGFLAERTPYRPGGSRRPPRGTYLRFRNKTMGVSTFVNDTTS